MIHNIDTTFFLGYPLFSWVIHFFPGIYYTRIFGSEVSIRNSSFFLADDQFGAITPVFLQVRK